MLSHGLARFMLLQMAEREGANMGELAQAMKMMENMSTCIQKYPNGKYGYVGSIPHELTKPYTSGFTQGRNSIVLDTEQEAIDKLLELGITEFQLPDCSWYKRD